MENHLYRLLEIDYFISFVSQYVDHIKFCSKFRTPCRFHVVGCDMSVSSPIVFSITNSVFEQTVSYETIGEKTSSEPRRGGVRRYLFSSDCI